MPVPLIPPDLRADGPLSWKNPSHHNRLDGVRRLCNLQWRRVSQQAPGPSRGQTAELYLAATIASAILLNSLLTTHLALGQDGP